MRAKRNRSSDHTESEGASTKRRKQQKNKSGMPRLSLWECGVGAVWK